MLPMSAWPKGLPIVPEAVLSAESLTTVAGTTERGGAGKREPLNRSPSRL